jgi:hypothetical protein
LRRCIQNHYAADAKERNDNNAQRTHANHVHLFDQVGEITVAGKDAPNGLNGKQ